MIFSYRKFNVNSGQYPGSLFENNFRCEQNAEYRRGFADRRACMTLTQQASLRPAEFSLPGAQNQKKYFDQGWGNPENQRRSAAEKAQMHNHTKSRWSRLALVLCVASLAAPAAEAHHSFAMYDTTVSLNVTGRLTRFVPGANHAQLIFEVLGPDGQPRLDAEGKPVVWGIETGPAAMIARQGVTVKDFPEGTIISVTLNPLRDGREFGVQAGSIIKCGTALPEGGCNVETGQVFMPDRD
jgi:hypothetical protein